MNMSPPPIALFLNVSNILTHISIDKILHQLLVLDFVDWK